MPSSSSVVFLLAAVASVVAAAPTDAASANLHVLWTDENCAAAANEDEVMVVDYVCSQDKHCNGLAKEGCQADFTCLWKGARCQLNRDRANKVCSVKDKVHKYCPAVLEGKCPEDFQVPEKCCKAKHRKYNRVLKTDSPDLVCCNVPCSEMKENAGCELPDRCGPMERSLFGYGSGGHHNTGPIFNDHLVSDNGYGKIIQYTGFEDHDHLPSEFSHLPDAEEITVDDLMHSLVEALSNDKDAYEWNSEVYSDPYTGKVKSGGELGGISYPDPNIFLSQIYGNHYGAALGQLSYYGNGFGYQSKPYSISPQDIHGPSYFDPIYSGVYNHHGGGGGGGGHHQGGGNFGGHHGNNRFGNYGGGRQGSFGGGYSNNNNQHHQQQSFSYSNIGGGRHQEGGSHQGGYQSNFGGHHQQQGGYGNGGHSSTGRPTQGGSGYLH